MRPAEVDDVPALVRLINEAYLVEAPFMHGDRIDEAAVIRLMNTPNSAFIVHGEPTLTGAVYVRWSGDRGFFGPLAVKPDVQSAGIGKALIAAAEAACRTHGAKHLDLDVMSFRPELLTYYERLGFTRNGTTPYPHPERLRVPAQLILMTRSILVLAVFVLTGCGGSREPSGAALAQFRQELESRGREDQRVREGVGVGGHVDSAQIAAMMHADSANTTWLKAHIERWGWPTVAQVGQEAVNSAFLIVQHAVHDTAFMRAMLPAIQESQQRGDLDGQAVALLTDRVEVKAGRPQIYGTQLSLKDGKWVLDPLADSAGVDARRRRMGLPPLAEYLRFVDSAMRAPQD